MPALPFLLRHLKLLKDHNRLLHIGAGLLDVGLELPEVFSDFRVREGHAALVAHVLEDGERLLVIVYGFCGVLHGMVSITHRGQGCSLTFAAAEDTAQRCGVAAFIQGSVLRLFVAGSESHVASRTCVADRCLAFLEVAQLVAQRSRLPHRGKRLVGGLGSELRLQDSGLRALAKRKDPQAIVAGAPGGLGKLLCALLSLLRCSDCSEDLLQVARDHPC
mmetsp:Transcript_47597/g.111290  ORF Transcript_47597/g.111290 Transcript_47597/m.111290 type:complete len:219 (-) Transcript_47597:139-795(-)